MSTVSKGSLIRTLGVKVRQSGYIGDVDRTRVARGQRPDTSGAGIRRCHYTDSLAAMITPSVTL